MDFAEYLLQHVGRFHNKETDLINVIMQLSSMFLAVFAIVLTATSATDTILKVPMEAALGILLIMGIIRIPSSGKKWNEVVYLIEQGVMVHYDYINGKEPQEKEKILRELRKIFKSKPSLHNTQKFIDDFLTGNNRE